MVSMRIINGQYVTVFDILKRTKYRLKNLIVYKSLTRDIY